MKEEMICDNCGSGSARTVYLAAKKPDDGYRPYAISDDRPKKPDEIVKCLDCGLVFVPGHRIDNSLFKDYEDSVDEGYIKEEKGRRRSANILLDRIGVFSVKGRMLEIGCANGFFLDEARKRGWDVVGIEPSRWARAYAEQKIGIRVLSATLDGLDFEKERFDVIVMLDVIEHMESPRKVLTMINRALKKDGLLVVTTPDVESVLGKVLRARWWGINRYHLFYFSRPTLENLFNRTGFEPVSYRSHARVFSCNYWFNRISAYSPFLEAASKLFLSIRGLRKQNLKISLYDQIEVYARKI